MDAIIFPLISAKRHANNVDFQEERYILEKVVYQLNSKVSEILPNLEIMFTYEFIFRVP